MAFSSSTIAGFVGNNIVNSNEAGAQGFVINGTGVSSLTGPSNGDVVPVTLTFTGGVNQTVNATISNVNAGANTFGWTIADTNLASTSLAQGLDTVSVVFPGAQASPQFSFTFDTLAPAAPTITKVGGIGDVVSGPTGDTVLTGTTESGSTVALNFGFNSLGSATVDGIGNWSYTLTTANLGALGQGPGKIITATAADAAGNVSNPTPSVPFTVGTVIESSGATQLVQEDNHFFLLDSNGNGPPLVFQSGLVFPGEFGAFTPIAAEKTTTGFEVAWKSGTNTFSVWNTDASGNFTGEALAGSGAAPGSDPALQALEPSFQQDLNGDGTIGVVCYVRGTRILTATGERTIDTLLQGDIVLTLVGEELSAQPVKWIGRRRIDLTAHPRPETVAPVRIQRDAFADNIPHSDVLVSPDHAVLVGGKLICARQLINGATIRQEIDRPSVEYFHLELGTHAIVFAEGLPAESYLNTGNQGFFANSGQPLVLHPDLTDEADYPTREAASCAPFVSDESNVRPVWQRLADRAAALGQAGPQLETSTDADLHIVAKGRVVRPMYGENGLYIFVLPKGATEVRIVSRACSPVGARPWLDERRCLGVLVERIMLRDARGVQDVPVDHPDMTQGWWAVEQDGTSLRRWTDGNATLPMPASHGPAMLEIRASTSDMIYLTGANHGRRAA
jgi:hypothetical protein